MMQRHIKPEAHKKANDERREGAEESEKPFLKLVGIKTGYLTGSGSALVICDLDNVLDRDTGRIKAGWLT